MKELLDDYLKKGVGIGVKDYLVSLLCFYFVPIVLINLSVEMFGNDVAKNFVLKIILGLVPLYFCVCFVLRFAGLLGEGERPFKVIWFYPFFLIGLISFFIVLTISVIPLGFKDRRKSKKLLVIYISFIAVLFCLMLGYLVWYFYNSKTIILAD